MDLDRKAYFKLYSSNFNDINFEEYRRISEAIGILAERYNYEIPEI